LPVDELDQREAPFWDAFVERAEHIASPFSTPGHKRGVGAAREVRDLLAGTLIADIPHGGGVDTTHRSHGVLDRAERLAAAAYGGDMARFLVNGSTTGNLAMLLASCGDGDEVIVSRMLHRSLLAGLVFCGARPVYVTPDLDPARNLPLDVTPRSIASALRAHPRARAVVLVSPSYVGITSDLRAIARLCDEVGVPLLVDEAWGPHFTFHPALPFSAMESGADAAVSSTHKMLAALTQGSTLVARHGRLDLDRLSTMVDTVQTTSPSSLIYATLDASRRQMALYGEQLLTETIALAHRLRDMLRAIEGLDVVGFEVVDDRATADYDPTRLIVDVHGLGLTGYEAEHYLRETHAVFVEMSDLVSVMLLVTIGDDAASIERAAAAFQGLQARRKPIRGDVGAAARPTGGLLFGGEQVMTPREAFLGRSRSVPIASAAGQVSAEAITPYPPGIPLVAPGERITRDILDYLRAGIAEGMYISGLSDPTLSTLRVVMSASNVA
jgi:lysine decarboxylase